MQCLLHTKEKEMDYFPLFANGRHRKLGIIEMQAREWPETKIFEE